MRIISGSAKSIRLTHLKGNAIHPTTDRVKETLFNILGAYVVGASVLDLFAGSGNLGLEAISRGAKSVDFVEKSYKSIEIIKENMRITNLIGNIIKVDAVDYIKKCQLTYDIIFADPPYNKGYINRIFSAIETNPTILSDNGILVVEHNPTELVYLKSNRFKIWRDKNFGDTLITFIEKAQ